MLIRINTIISGADTVIAGLTGNVSGAIILGTGTASDTANDIMERGGTEEEALIGGAVSGSFVLYKPNQRRRIR